MSHAWMPFYVADYLGKTQRLTTAEHGAYMLLIMEYWQSGGLPVDDAQLARICRMTQREWAKAKPSIAEYFEDGWHHQRVEEELAKAGIKHERRVEAGRSGGKAKAVAKQTPSNATGNAPSNALASSSEPEKEDTEGTNVPSAESGFAAVSDRERLRTTGVEWLARAVGRKPQSLQGVIGRWLKQTGDDAAAVLGVLWEARDRQIAEPIAWIEAALKAKPGPVQPPPMDWQERAEWYRKLGRWPAYWGSRDSVPKESRHLFPGVFEKLQVVSG